MSMHLYAELYANLTRFPLGERIQPSTAVEIIRQLQESVQTVDLTRDDYTAAPTGGSSAGWSMMRYTCKLPSKPR